MLCVVCEKQEADKFIDIPAGRMGFHSACAVCFICNKANADSVVPYQQYGLLFIHEACSFTPEQLEKLSELKSNYRPE